MNEMINNKSIVKKNFLVNFFFGAKGLMKTSIVPKGSLSKLSTQKGIKKHETQFDMIQRWSS